MENNKETLRTLLEFIGDLINRDGYEWFHDELSILVSKKILTENDTTIKLSAVTVKEYGSIDKYFEEGLIPMIDYSGISDLKVRFQLERDAIEMGKVRLGYYAKGISFIDFCKYAHFQSEELVNHYFRTITNNSVQEAIAFMHKYNAKTKKGNFSKTEDISEISYIYKLYTIKNKCNFSYKYLNTLKSINKVRNLALHRDSNKELNKYEKIFLQNEEYNKVYESLLVLRDVVIEQTENMAHETN